MATTPVQSPVDISPEGSISPLVIPRKRPIKDLLGADYYIPTVPGLEYLTAPLPGRRSEDYSPHRLRQGIRYADASLRNNDRKLSPIGQRAMSLYQDSCIHSLELIEEKQDMTEKEIEDMREKWVAQVRDHEEAMQYQDWRRTLSSESAQELQDKLLDLRKLHFYARYGDYMADACNNLKIEMEKGKLPGWTELVGRYWSDIDRKLDSEQEVFSRTLRGGTLKDHETCPTSFAIQHACRRTGIDYDDTRIIIKTYAKRNEAVHSNLETMIKNGEFNLIAIQLVEDAKSLAVLIPQDDPVSLRVFQAVIETVINSWFIRDEEEPDAVGLWAYKPILMQRRKEMKADEATASNTRRQLRKELNNDLMKRLRAEEAARELIRQATTGDLTRTMEQGSLRSSSMKRKRVPSEAYEAETESYATQTKAYDALLAVQRQATTKHAAYVAAWGSDAPPVLPLEDPTMSPPSAAASSSKSPLQMTLQIRPAKK